MPCPAANVTDTEPFGCAGNEKRHAFPPSEVSSVAGCPTTSKSDAFVPTTASLKEDINLRERAHCRTFRWRGGGNSRRSRKNDESAVLCGVDFGRGESVNGNAHFVDLALPPFAPDRIFADPQRASRSVERAAVTECRDFVPVAVDAEGRLVIRRRDVGPRIEGNHRSARDFVIAAAAAHSEVAGAE